jgi:anthranilate synthase
MERKIPMFGVCLGLQGMVEALGGELGVLEEPQHGVHALINHENSGVFNDLPQPMEASRYHSLYAIEDKLPDDFEITAKTPDGVIMGIQHKTLPMAAVQFHPESIHALRREAGLQLIDNALKTLLH